MENIEKENNKRIKEEMLKKTITIDYDCRKTFMKLVKKVYILKSLYFEIEFDSNIEKYEELLKKRDSYAISICKMLMFLSSRYFNKYNEYILDKKINLHNTNDILIIVNEYQEYIENIYKEIIIKFHNLE